MQAFPIRSGSATVPLIGRRLRSVVRQETCPWSLASGFLHAPPDHEAQPVSIFPTLPDLAATPVGSASEGAQPLPAESVVTLAGASGWCGCFPPLRGQSAKRAQGGPRSPRRWARSRPAPRTIPRTSARNTSSATFARRSQPFCASGWSICATSVASKSYGKTKETLGTPKNTP
jgi:hypothetical protein